MPARADLPWCICAVCAAGGRFKRPDICGRCWHADNRQKAPSKARTHHEHERQRALHGGRLVWVALLEGVPVGVFLTEARALAVSDVVHCFKLDQQLVLKDPTPQPFSEGP